MEEKAKETINWDRTDYFPTSKTENDNNNKFVVGKFNVKYQLLHSYLASDMKFPQVNERPPFFGFTWGNFMSDTNCHRISWHLTRNFPTINKSLLKAVTRCGF